MEALTFGKLHDAVQEERSLSKSGKYFNFYMQLVYLSSKRHYEAMFQHHCFKYQVTKPAIAEQINQIGPNWFPKSHCLPRLRTRVLCGLLILYVPTLSMWDYHFFLRINKSERASIFPVNIRKSLDLWNYLGFVRKSGKICETPKALTISHSFKLKHVFIGESNSCMGIFYNIMPSVDGLIQSESNKPAQ